MPKSRSRRALSSAAVVFALLVVATLAAFAWAQHVKRDPLVVDKITYDGKKGVAAFSPNGDCLHDKVRIRFRTTTSDDGNVQIVRPGGRLVKTLARETFLKRYRFHTFLWDGTQRAGGIAPPGRYKVRITLDGQDRVLVMPGAVKLRREAQMPGHSCVGTEARPAQAKGGGA
jgi:hypothetical protein